MSIDRELAFAKNLVHAWLKTQNKKPLSKIVTDKNFHNLIKSIYQKNPTENIILNDERLNDSALRPGTREWCLLSPFYFNIVVEILPTEITKESKIRSVQIRK